MYQNLNFASDNAVVFIVAIVVAIYGYVLIREIAKGRDSWLKEFAIGIFLVSFGELAEQLYYSTARYLEFDYPEIAYDFRMHWIVSLIAFITIAGYLYHVKSITKHHFKGSLWKIIGVITLGVFIGSLFWSSLSVVVDTALPPIPVLSAE